MIFGVFCTLAIIVGFLGVLAEVIRQQLLPPERRHNGPRPPKILPSDTVVDAKTLAVTAGEVEQILRKRFPYFNTLNEYQRRRFVGRTLRFVKTKLFIIKGGDAYREMPVLTSAAAVQLTFGLEDYRLPWFRYIQIHPTEFFGSHSLRILVGNVSGHTITVAWNHLLHGYELGADGSNVALHEMAHALYYQNTEVEDAADTLFCSRYNRLLKHCTPALKHEASGEPGLYTHYGTTNLQEFWAESVELFFEKSAGLKHMYPDVYKALCKLLNQDPLTKEKVLNRPMTILFHELIGAVWKWQRKFWERSV